MNKLILFLLIFPAFTFANCEIHTYKRIIKINTIQDENVIKSSDCSSEIKSQFVNFISNTTGELSAKHLSRYFKNENNIDVNLTPKSFTVKVINNLIEDGFSDKNIIVKEVTSLFSASSFNLEANDQLSFECKNCDKPGEKNILAKLNNKKIWLNALIHKKRKAYILTKNITDLKMKLSSSDFKEVSISDKGNTILFDDLDNIRFYKPTKLLRSGETVKKYDLRKRVLVKFGQKIQVSISNQNIKLKTKAIARRNGYIDDVIELINEKSKKTIYAKVIDFDKVQVEL